MGFTCLHDTIYSTITLWFCSTGWDQVLHRRTYAHFFPSELQQLRDNHSESQGTQFQQQKKIINIVELCPKVDSPLERTSEANPRVQYVDQVQNPTKNPFTYLMATVAFFNSRWSAFLFIFKLILSSVAFIFFATYLVSTRYQVPSQESSFDKYICYFSAILVKYMQCNEMKSFLRDEN